MVLNTKKIEVALARKEKTFSELYKDARISTVTAGRVRKGLPVQPKIAGKLAAALGVDVSELIDDS